ncbi:MAG: AAA family ATPase [Candidatus Falkowbacteria bacterium]
MARIIIGLTGPMVTGKGTVAEYLRENYQASVYGFSGPLRDVLKRLHLSIVRENMAKLSEALRSTFHQHLISATIVHDIGEDDAEVIVLDGIRRPSDLEQARALEGFVLIAVHAEQQTRHQRLLKRSQNLDDQSKTLEAFQADEQAEADREIPVVMAQAQHIIDNNHDIETLYRQVDALMQRLRNQEI